MSERNVFVYAIRSEDGAIKVGTAQDVEKRLRQLQGANHHLLAIAYRSKRMVRIVAEQVECEAHHRLRDKRIFGEWFRCSADEASEAIAQAIGYVRNTRNCWASYTLICRNLRTAKSRRYRQRGSQTHG